MSLSPAVKAKRAVNEMERVAPQDLVVHRMGGDASDRRYFRLQYGSFGQEKTYVMMELSESGPFIKSEEVTLYHDESGELPFLNIHRFLEGLGVPVPKVLHRDLELGVIVLEDLGDVLLGDVARSAEPNEVLRLYKRAIDQLVYLQTFGTERLTPDCVATRQAFTPELFAWEFDHFIEYGIEARQGKLAAAARDRIRRECRRWAERLAGLPRVFVHRDYHSRNLMVQGSRLMTIDFQDALMGPATYDLASLLRDSYVDLGWPLVDKLVDHYLDVWARRTGKAPERRTFCEQLWATAMQRNLKAAGRFVFIERVKGKPGYEENIPRTLAYLPGYVQRAPALEPLYKLLRPHVPELQ